MGDDERAICDLVEAWMAASRAGDTAAVLDMVTDDVVFTVPGQPPFGKAAFADMASAMAGVRMEGTSEIVELELLGDGWAFIRNRIAVTLHPPQGAPVKHAGYTLTLLRKDDGRWRLARDANLVTAEG